MNIIKQSEEIIQWVDNSSQLKELNVDVELKISDMIGNIQNLKNSALFTISIRMQILLSGNSEVIFDGITKCIYKVILDKDTTLHQFAMVYVRPYTYFKSEFEKYKKGKSISTIEIPEFKEDSPCIISAFKTKLPDILNV